MVWATALCMASISLGQSMYQRRTA